MLPHRYSALLVGAVCLLAGAWAVVAGVLGLAGMGNGNVWTLLVGIALSAFGVAGVRAFIERDERAQTRSERRSRRWSR